ncbi:hypothetical protein GUJ93_ZPchr0010g8655 [Zizania palustris]|uniref:Uncharacterized protein n=1 Tax=Zizania palustris TaxID=103762 RepID=A0A8J5WBT7_ZIZPA|nr:hypothetical protein GUJ93_ZPchr0010g8655 [Zizania palustris]
MQSRRGLRGPAVIGLGSVWARPAAQSVKVQKKQKSEGLRGKVQPPAAGRPLPPVRAAVVLLVVSPSPSQIVSLR